MRALRKRKSEDEGAVAVEFALILPVLVLLLFGILEFGLLLKDYVGVTSATRSAARIASAEPRLATFDTDARDAAMAAMNTTPGSTVQEIWVYKANASGFPGTDTTGAFATCTTQIDCVKFTLSGPNTWVESGSFDANKIVACPGASDVTSVGVYIKSEHKSLTQLIFKTIGVNQRTVMRFEPMPAINCIQQGNCRPIV